MRADWGRLVGVAVVSLEVVTHTPHRNRQPDNPSIRLYPSSKFPPSTINLSEMKMLFYYSSEIIIRDIHQRYSSRDEKMKDAIQNNCIPVHLSLTDGKRKNPFYLTFKPLSIIGR